MACLHSVYQPAYALRASARHPFAFAALQGKGWGGRRDLNPQQQAPQAWTLPLSYDHQPADKLGCLAASVKFATMWVWYRLSFRHLKIHSDRSLARFLLQVARMKQKDEGDYELVEPFETNDNSLQGVNSEIAFTLGVEWQMFRQRLKIGQPFQTLCLSLNTNRLVKMAERQRRFVEDRPTPWAGWSEIWVGDYLG